LGRVIIRVSLLGTGVFYELYHYKPKRKITSLRCYAFMELDELKPGPCVIEL